MTAYAEVQSAAEEVARYVEWLRDQGMRLDGNISLANRINRYARVRNDYTEGTSTYLAERGAR